MDCWVPRFTTNNNTHHQHFLVKRCASANKRCLPGKHHGPHICGQHHPPTFISLLGHARQRKNHGLQWVILNSGNCRQLRSAKKDQHQINTRCVQTKHPPTFISLLKAMRWVRRRGEGAEKICINLCVCRMAEIFRKGTLGSVLAWRAASLLLIRLLFVLKTSVVRERKTTSCRVSLWGHDSRNTRIPYSWNFSLVPDYKNILQCHVF